MYSVHLGQPRLRESSWTDQEVRADVLPPVLPQQRQGHRLHQGIVLLLIRVLRAMVGSTSCDWMSSFEMGGVPAGKTHEYG
jgi:hypothetical protein